MMNAFTMFTKRNRSGGEFLLIDAANAHTLLDIAETTPDAIEAHRLTQLARETLETINRYLGALEMDASLRAVLERSRDKLELRLAALERQYPVAAACL
jgi:hypothetical protein